ncbi:MAG: hypothetical protein IT509_07790, partial [Rhodocyclaceae bacterium]|nr:hypothetical protein [Rhodocyclaceae bacterium]
MDNADRSSHGLPVEASDTVAEAPAEDLSQSILYEVVENHICKITLNRPHRKNA